MIDCPLLNRKIESTVCFDISMVAEHLAPPITMPIKVREIKDFENLCLNCPNHRDD